MTDQENAGIGQRFGGVQIQERYGLVLVLMMVGYVLEALSGSVLTRVVNALIWATVLFVALWAPGINNRLRLLGGLATAALLVAAGILSLAENPTARIVLLVVLALVQVLALISIALRVAQHDRVGAQTVLGAIAGYFLIGLAMGSFYQAMDLQANGAAFNGITSDGDYIYFSLVTLTTVGFGDITPATDLAKRIVSVEALIGQVFLVTLVARLVALWGRPLRKDDPAV